MLIGVAFWVLAMVAVASGVAVFVVDSMARATYALALSFIAVECRSFCWSRATWG